MPFAWRPGMHITASRLNSGILAGNVAIVADDVTISAAGSQYDDDYMRGFAQVDFPPGFFTTIPFIVVTARSTVPGFQMEATYANATVDGFEARMARPNLTETIIDWIAIEM